MFLLVDRAQDGRQDKGHMTETHVQFQYSNNDFIFYDLEQIKTSLYDTKSVLDHRQELNNKHFCSTKV